MAPSANSAKPFLTLDHVTIRLRDQFVFEETSWQIRSDEHWAVIGANGAGKSTLVKAIAGDVPIVRGGAVYHFMNEFGFSPDGQVARVAFDTETDLHGIKTGFDSFSAEQDGKVTVAETILWGSLTGEQAEEGRLRETAQQLGMEHLLGRASHVLSNGEAKKVLIARALLQSPCLLILDEPCDGLDYALHQPSTISTISPSFIVTALKSLFAPRIRASRIGTKVAIFPRTSFLQSSSASPPSTHREA